MLESNLLRYDKDKVITFFDTETQNLCFNENVNLPWQIAMISRKGNNILSKKNIYIKWNPLLKISPFVARMTGYDERKVLKYGISPDDALQIVDSEFKAADIISGHNILGFDAFIIKSLYQKLGYKNYYNIVPKALDTLCLARAYRLDIPYNRDDDFISWQYKLLSVRQRLKSCNLGNLGKELDIEHDYSRLHDALIDIELNIKVFDKLKWIIEI